jgi:hypothetical protein
MPIDSKRVQTIFLAAVEKETPAERAAFLDEACIGNPVLRARLDAAWAATVHVEPDAKVRDRYLLSLSLHKGA